MSSLIENYNNVVKRVKELNSQIDSNKQAIANLKTNSEGDISARITNLEEQLVKIDDYLLKIKGFQELAKKNLESQNVLTIEAPPGYRVNLNRLRNWAMMIDPMSSNDPYAQRVYVTAKCDECFLEQKKAEFSNRIEELKADRTSGLSSEISSLEKSIESLTQELDAYAMSDEIIEFARNVVEENHRCWNKVSPEVYSNSSVIPEVFSPGAYAAPLVFSKEQRERIKILFEDYYDVESARVLLPVELPNDKEFIMTVTCTPARSKELDAGLQNLVLNKINLNPAGLQKIYVIDGARYNSVSMGTLKQLEGSDAMEQIPRNPDQLTSVLEQIVSSFADLDEILELRDSIQDYNKEVEESKKLPLSTLILYGWPNAYEGRDRELIQRIMMNYERYGLSIITVTYANSEKEELSDKNPMPEYAYNNAVHISMLAQKNGKNYETYVTFPGTEPQRFKWYVFNGELSPSFVTSLKENVRVKETIGNEYIMRYSLTDIPPYVRDYKKIELPFGIDGKDIAHSVSFENENFATYLVGASRSGKSTLLHTLIAGLIRNYHPDNVELWLADFKQLEFKRYIKHLPPHVKYVLLDESTELVYDLIDRLTNEMLERQKLFSRLGKQRIDQVDPTELSKPLPVIFVILDEFSIMSQSIADSPIYKLRLQNILAKGAALGIKFLFSSQTFTTGVAGLTATARAQIQQRIAMKGSKEEISETLELSSNLKTEQVRNWMDALPPHYALVKFRISADTLPQVKRFLVMYFKDYAPRDDMIDAISSSMKKSNEYITSDISAYVDKHPVLVDGNSYDAFNDAEFISYINGLKSSSTDFAGDEMFISFGTPRLMVKMKTAALSAETRENILLIARAAEQACSASILLSAMKSYALQGGKVQIWAYGKNRLYMTYKRLFIDNGYEIIEGIDAVCDSIYQLKKAISNKESSNTLIVMMGMDRICMDFDFVDGSVAESKQESKIADTIKKLVENGAAVTSENDEEKQKYAMEWMKYRRPFVNKAKAEGKSQDEIKSMLSELELEFRKKQGYESTPDSANNSAVIQEETEPQEKANEQKKEHQPGAYNASDDFLYVFKQGSRLGYHFMMNLSTLADLKQTGLKDEYFRYKMSFQISVDDSRKLFNSKIASALPEHICQYDDTLEKYSFRPYLHKGVSWEGWYVGDDGNVISPYEESDD